MCVWPIQVVGLRPSVVRGLQGAEAPSAGLASGTAAILIRRPAVTLKLQDAKDEARRAIVAWLDGKDPMDLQAADLPTLAASLGGDEAAIMAAFEQKVGRVPPVTHSDTRPGSTGDQPTRSDSTPFEIAQQNTNGPDRATIH